MILRRIIAHFRKQEWTAIGIDFLIVVLGVFVATQVTNWNEAREARARAEIYSARLADDLRFEAWQTEYLIAYYKEVLANAERAAGALTDGPALSDEQLLISAYRASQYLYYGTRRATYDEMVATGDIGLIADRRLRETALTFYGDPTIDVVTDGARNSEYRRAFRRAVPADVQRALLDACGDRLVEPGDFDGVVGSLDYACELDLWRTRSPPPPPDCAPTRTFWQRCSFASPILRPPFLILSEGQMASSIICARLAGGAPHDPAPHHRAFPQAGMDRDRDRLCDRRARCVSWYSSQQLE